MLLQLVVVLLRALQLMRLAVQLLVALLSMQEAPKPLSTEVLSPAQVLQLDHTSLLLATTTLLLVILMATLRLISTQLLMATLPMLHVLTTLLCTLGLVLPSLLALAVHRLLLMLHRLPLQPPLCPPAEALGLITAMFLGVD